MICPKCNNSSPDNARFCEHCGAALLNGQQVVRGRGTHQQDWNETRQGWETSWSEQEARPAEAPPHTKKKRINDATLSFRTAIWGVLLGFWALLLLAMLIEWSGPEVLIFWLVVGVLIVWRFVVLLRKYNRPESRAYRQAQQEKARQDWEELRQEREKWRAEAPLRKEKRKQEAYRKQMAYHDDHLPVAAVLVTTKTNTETSKGVIGTAARTLVGGALLGPFGAAVGLASGTATTRTVSQEVTFSVRYASGRTGIETVRTDSKRFKELARLLVETEH